MKKYLIVLILSFIALNLITEVTTGQTTETNFKGISYF